jgi:hypothetical protein
MGRSAAYHRGIRGSAALATRRIAVPAEAPGPGEVRRVPFAGELLGAVRLRSGYAALPLEAFDRASEVLEAEQQAAYLQLLRLAWGEGRSSCRAGKRDLMARLRLSERRLNRVLDALVARRLARPLHRDNRGTLWRVYLPAEVEGGAPGDAGSEPVARAPREVRERFDEGRTPARIAASIEAVRRRRARAAEEEP